jgi:hypothetical protein
MTTLTVTLTSKNQAAILDALVCGARFYSKKEVRQGQAILTYIPEGTINLSECLDIPTLENLGVEWAVS